MKKIVENLKRETEFLIKGKIVVDKVAMEKLEEQESSSDNEEPTATFSIPSYKYLKTKEEEILKNVESKLDTSRFNHSYSDSTTIDVKALESMELASAIEMLIGMFYGKSWDKVNTIRLKKQFFGSFLKGDDVIPLLEIENLPKIGNGEDPNCDAVSISLYSSLIYSSFRREYGLCSKKDDLSLLLLLISFSARNLRR